MHRSAVDATFAVIPTWVIDSGISDRAVRAYLVLRTYADRNGEAWPSRQTLATRMGCSIDTVDRAIDELVALGAITVERRRTKTGSPTSNLYTLRSVPPTTDAMPLSTGTRTGAPTHPAPVRGGVPAPVRHELDPSELETPQPPRHAGEPCSTERPIHSRCRGCGTAPRQRQAAAKAERPDWCGECDERTRLIENDNGRGVHRCPTCHPLSVRRPTP